MHAVPDVDYLLIGHVCRDLTPDGPRLGGTVTFCALTARALGMRAAILTSAPASLTPLLAPIDGIPLTHIPANQPTTFENSYTPACRVQTLWGRAQDLRHHHVPPEWRSPAIVHLAPVADEVDPALAGSFDGALVGVTPQGWMRQWDGDGRVSFRPWLSAPQVLAHAQAVVFSIEDVAGDEDLVRQLAGQARVLVVTRGRLGSTLYVGGRPQAVPAPRVVERDPTGAGDIFAASFFIRLKETSDPLAAAHFATALASASVTQVGLRSIPDAALVRDARK